MNLEDDFIEVMQADEALMAILNGGVYSAIAVGEISKQLTPAVFDANKELQPCALVKMGVETPRGPYPDSVQTPVQIFFYQYRTASAIDDAMALAFALFNYRKIGDGTWRVEYESGAWNQSDDVLNAYLHIMRFVVVRRKLPLEGGS